MATLGNDLVKLCCNVMFSFIAKGLLALSDYNVKGLQRQRQFSEKPWVYKNRKTHQVQNCAYLFVTLFEFHILIVCILSN